jgi:hypothetical protein
LYQQAEVRRAKVEQAATDFIKASCPFAPDINTSPQIDSQSEHIEKLYTSRRPVEAALDRERMRLFGKFDPETGRELYKPKTGRAPVLKRDKKVPVGEYLHQYQSVKTEPVVPEGNVARYIVSKSKSDKIYERMKQSRYKELFEALKLPQEAVLSAEYANIERLPTDVANILRPLLTELQMMGETLDLEEFCASMDNLMRVLSPIEKATVLRKPNEHYETPASQPTPKRPSSVNSDLSLYEREMLKKKALEERMRHEKLQAETAKVAECSFRPQITPYDPAKHCLSPLDDLLGKPEDEGELIPKIKAKLTTIQ